nr:hypothetical protein [Tanacetum cinerariifolium]
MMKICTTLQKKALDLEDELKRKKNTQQTKIDGLKRRVKKLEKKHMSRTHKLKRLYKVSLTARVISSSDDEALDKEDTSIQGRIDKIDADEDIALVSTHDDVIVQDKGIKDVGEEKVVELVTTAKMIIDIVVDVAQVTTTLTITAESTKTNVEVTQTPKWKGVMIQEPEETITTKTNSSQQPQVQDIDVKLQAKIDEEDRLAREKAQQVEEVNLAWDDFQAKIKADYEMVQRLQAEEQEQLTDAEKVKLFMEFLEKRRKFFAAKRAEEKRNKPLTKAQQRSLMCTYLKNMDGWKPRALKNKSFAEIQELFNKTMKRINNFVDFRTELLEESAKKAQEEIVQESNSKREGDELEQERSKKQKVEDAKESKELKKCLEIIPDDGDDVTIDATHLSVKTPIVDYKIYKEGKKKYF